MEYKLLSSLTKVFADEAPQEEQVSLSILRGETASFQVAVKDFAMVRLHAWADGYKVTLREVLQVPVTRACNPGVDDDYLRKAPGLYPDALRPVENPGQITTVGWWKSVWIDAEPLENAPADTEITVSLEVEEGGAYQNVATLQVPVHLVNKQLPPQKLLQTNWFHCDCLADYYRVPVWSEEHWAIVENFLRSAARMGINLILTPIFTPALDTQVGGERTTNQLVDITCSGGEYSFGFEKLDRWVKLCLDCGMTHFEMAHLYSQWGSNRCPKIMATVDGVYRRIFGWETEGTSPEYAAFLASFLPALAERLRQLGIADRCFFHIMDEPHIEHLDCYLQQKGQAAPYLQGFKMMDALSDFAFYQTGAVEVPVPATNSPDLEKFLAADMEQLWLYYCCSQGKDVSNRFIAMPSQRTRMLGVQLYTYKAAGFLQWGFNFYNSRLSIRQIDPYAVTDSDEAFPAGDPFVVYPGEGGTALESLRYMNLRQAMHDLQALQLLESLAGREAVEKLIAETAGGPVTLDVYPRDKEFLPALRRKVNEAIETYC